MRVRMLRLTQRLSLLGACSWPLVSGVGCTSFGAQTVGSSTVSKTSNSTNGVVQASFTEKAVTSLESMDENWAPGEKAYIEKDYAKAEKHFHSVAENTKNSPLLAEKARFYEAECLRMQNYYPKAADTLSRMLNDFPSGVYREKAVGIMFQIANFWLEDTSEEMEKKSKGANWWSISSNYIHTERTKPFLDQEGRALELLTKVHINDPTGPYSDKALYIIGVVNFFRGNFKEADIAFSQLVDTHDKSPYRAKAAELAIMAKNNSTGGPEYDGQKTADALRMVQQAKKNIPELAKERGEFLDRQIIAIRTQQADKDIQAAEFYQRTGHPGAAYFYYELVIRRYPGTDYATRASAKKAELEKEIEVARNHSDGFWGDMRRGWDRYVLGQKTGELSAIKPMTDADIRNPAAQSPVNDLPKSMPTAASPYGR
ncbi:hypothetical protein KIH39_02235 [Telmatocola sphagniphila]|uniref:Outer membrane protein assembly factor BamD n=1 Tax=Telmatocola sphagniphila TaxID=1123043 RepID=A0A8E6B621_9BACT|nr:hypothetical protein [Telmatocola sphagniphila]QVL32760.1 hypothetical protein KIH39_02235 [Telmatocola sphagniphila]